MTYFSVTVVSPSGMRDTYGVEAANANLARENVQTSMLMSRPNWRVVMVQKLYSVA